MEKLNDVETFILVLPMLLMGFFLIRKLYFHFEFVKLHDRKLAEESLVDVFINPFLCIQLLYIFIPIFIKSERKKERKELDLERKIGTSIVAFWLSLLLTILTAVTLALYKKH